MLEIEKLKHSYQLPDRTYYTAVDIAKFSLSDGSQTAIYGKSGSGKTTFLNCISGITKPNFGKIKINSIDICELNESARDKFRSKNLGIIFQNFNLLKGFTVLENVLLGMKFAGNTDRKKAIEILNRIGLSDKLNLKTKNLSSGEQQRVAIARALVNSPKILLADEPTANLDLKNTNNIITLIREICSEKNISLLLITHEREILELFENKINFDELNKQETRD